MSQDLGGCMSNFISLKHAGILLPSLQKLNSKVSGFLLIQNQIHWISTRKCNLSETFHAF